MGSTPQRSFIKGIVWEGVSFLLALLVIYMIYKDIIISLKITIILTLLKIPFYFIHERLWKKIRWGKISDAKSKK